ncbi:MAG: hypothetical protein COS96_01500 [Candidatus Nealsonbacteria bacterium CG07_land_8_20_14_0_80_39_13]|nr:MAG: hypothetical protein COS96_01500 [Candidatus Nealsonbacteria bacterium CG07_land_8_20_14_0_80_39_13]
MINFNIRKAEIFQALVWENWPFFKFAGILGKLSFLSFLLSFLLFLFGFLGDSIEIPALSDILGFSTISLALYLFFLVGDLFFTQKLKKPNVRYKLTDKIPDEFNLAEFLSLEAAKAILKAKENSTAIFYFLLKDNPELNFIFSREFISITSLKKNLREQIKQNKNDKAGGANFQEIITLAIKKAGERGHDKVEKGDLLIALAEYDSFFKKILIESETKKEDIENLVWWLEYLKNKIGESKRFWEWKRLIRLGSLAKSWSFGYTPLLDQFSIDLTEKIKAEGFPEMIGRQEEAVAAERILGGQETKNILIIGEKGSARKSIVQELARRSALGESLPELNYRKFIQLDLTFLATKINSLDEAEIVLDKIFHESAKAGNIVLVIDEFHNFIGKVTPKPGVIDVSGIISSYLSIPRFNFIGITDFAGFHKKIEQDSSLLPFFGKIELQEMSQKKILMILEELALKAERKYKKFITFPALRNIVVFCDKYMPASFFPEKAIKLLDEAMIYLSQTKDPVLLPKHIAKVFSDKTHIPVGEMNLKEKEILIDLENLIHSKIINQEEAVRETSTALRRARSGVSDKKGPMGTFLFLGPSGVGKSEAAKVLTEIYFGSQEKMICLDMSEFQSVSDVTRLIGGADEEGLLTTPIRENPFSLILLDEIEKSHSNILNLFLQVLDDGRLTDGLGRKCDFKNSIIIATSNAGYQIILDALENKEDWGKVKEKLLDYVFTQGIFRPEFINRFDAVVVFKPLTKKNLMDISELMLKGIAKGLEKKDIKFIFSEGLKEKIVELSYEPKFGAREMKRVVQDKVENVLASAMLSGEIKRGSIIGINPTDFSLIIH